MNPGLVRVAALELGAREANYPEQVEAGRRSADEAGRSLAAWRAIVALLDRGEAVPEACFPTLQSAWDEIASAINAAVEHRTSQCTIDGGGPGERLTALRHIRSLIIRSAARQGATRPQHQAKELAA